MIKFLPSYVGSKSYWVNNNDDPNENEYATEIKITRLKKETEEGASRKFVKLKSLKKKNMKNILFRENK